MLVVGQLNCLLSSCFSATTTAVLFFSTLFVCFFCSDMDSSNAASCAEEILARWNALSKEEKQRWEAESQKDLKRYQAECAQAGVEPKLYSHVAGQLRNARRAVRPVDNVGGAGLVDPKAAIYEAFDANQLKKKCASGDYELLMVKNDMAAPTR